MAAAYFCNRMHHVATFELIVRRLPENRSYLIAAGLEQVIEYLENLRFSQQEIDYLSSLPVFKDIDRAFFDYLRDFRFSGEVWAIPEGAPAFANEPLLRVTAPIIEAQVLETFLLTTINFQTLIASKAARVVEAAQGRGVIEFGGRRAHGSEAALMAARAAYLAGCIGTSNVEAGYRFGIPVYGTAAHSWTMAFDDEMDAFRAYFRFFPDSTILLLDTYDTIEAARKAASFGPRLRGVRIDSGDMVELSRRVRQILDSAGMSNTRIVASGDLNEWRIAELLEAGAPIDLFGVGTDLATSRDAPALGGVYKLVEQTRGGTLELKMKLSTEKATYPGSKQVWRTIDESGSFAGDIISCADETFQPPAFPLLECVMVGGKRTAPARNLAEIREQSMQQLRRLPLYCRRLRGAEAYPVRYSRKLQETKERLERELARHL